MTDGQVAGIAVGLAVLIPLIITCAILYYSCLRPTCPCYYHKYRSTRTVAVAAQQTPQVTATTTNTNTINSQPSPPSPLTYNCATGYQPYPATPPTATTVKS